MCIGKEREEVEKGRDVLGGAQGPVRSELKSERFCGKGAKSAARRARPARPPEGRRADAHAERRERDKSKRCQAMQAFDEGVVSQRDKSSKQSLSLSGS